MRWPRMFTLEWLSINAQFYGNHLAKTTLASCLMGVDETRWFVRRNETCIEFRDPKLIQMQFY